MASAEQKYSDFDGYDPRSSKGRKVVVAELSRAVVLAIAHEEAASTQLQQQMNEAHNLAGEGYVGGTK